MAREKTIKAYGGQAVLNGVMMRGATSWAVAVRTPEGDIALTSHPVPTWSQRWLPVPMIRGLVTLVESLMLGYRALAWSGEQVIPEEERSQSKVLEFVVTAVGLVAVLGLFVGGPALAAGALPGVDGGFRLSVLEGALRILLLVAYIGGISRIPEIRRVFEYHGAEHKAVSALEAGEELTPASAQRFTTRHPRCGTTFLLVVMVVAVLAHAFIGDVGWQTAVAARLAMVPLVAGVSFELIRAAARHVDRPWVLRALAPGLAMQRLTTREPTLDQLEVAMAALLAVVEADQTVGREAVAAAGAPALSA